MRMAALVISAWNMPLASTRSGIADGGSVGLPSTSTICRPTRRRGIFLASAAASPAAGAETIKLAAVRMPSRWPCSTASFTSSAMPKSSAVTIRPFTPLRDDGVFAGAKKLEELHALAQATHQHLRRGEHLAHDRCDLRRSEIELLVEVLHRLEDFGVAEVRIVERRDLRTVLGQQVGVVREPAIFLRLLVEKG